MTHPDVIRDILRDSNYSLILFTDEEVDALRQRITSKEVKGKTRYYVTCLVRNRDIMIKAEEVVRQLYLARLMNEYGYERRRIAVEHIVRIGRAKKRADIVIFDEKRSTSAYIVIEVKAPKLKDGREQLDSYLTATGAKMGVWTNGESIAHYQRLEPNYIDPIDDIPTASQTLRQLLDKPFTLKELIMEDRLINDRLSLKQIILEMEDTVLANAGVDVFEEVFKLIFLKLYDESESQKDKQYIDFYLDEQLSDADRHRFVAQKEALKEWSPKRKLRLLEFRATGLSSDQLEDNLQKLFIKAKEHWSGIFPRDSKLDLRPSHLARCVKQLHSIKLFNSNLQVVDEAFEYLVNKSAKSDKGQYFTPRHVIDMCVKMFNPQRGEYMIDTAAGSCGFPVHNIFGMTGKLFTNEEMDDEDKEAALRVFGIDFDERAVRVARTLNLIAGDGETNVLHLNTLDYPHWNETMNRSWGYKYSKGFQRMLAVKNGSDYKLWNFGILMANPPFAGDIKEPNFLAQYELSIKANGKQETKMGRDILFIERNLDFLRPGGRMAVVLPQGRFNNISDKRIRDYIAERARILAVVGLHGNSFKPHTGTKTSVLFIQKWNDDDCDLLYHCPHVDNYPIFFGVSQKGGKNKSGDYVYLLDEDGQRKLDKHSHLIIDHDLHNHDGELPHGIAEAFIAFAKEQDFGFWREGITPNF